MIVAIPALLPVTGFATWSGWFAFEELDLLILGAAAGGYASLAVRTRFADEPGPEGPHFSLLTRAMLAGFALSCIVATYRGIAEAGGFMFDWVGTYHSPMNTLRLAKSYAMALLLWPLLRSAWRANERRTSSCWAAVWRWSLARRFDYRRFPSVRRLQIFLIFRPTTEPRRYSGRCTSAVPHWTASSR